MSDANTEKMKLTKALKKLLKDELGGFFRRLAEREKKFLAEKAARIAEETLALRLATTDAEKRIARRVLRALVLSVENEILQQRLSITKKNRELLGKAIRLVVSTLIAAIL